MGAPAAAKRLGIRLVTLYRIIDSGVLPAYKVRRVIRLKRADVDAYIERCRVQPGTLAHLHPADELAYRRWKRYRSTSVTGESIGGEVTQCSSGVSGDRDLRPAPPRGGPRRLGES